MSVYGLDELPICISQNLNLEANYYKLILLASCKIFYQSLRYTYHKEHLSDTKPVFDKRT